MSHNYIWEKITITNGEPSERIYIIARTLKIANDWCRIHEINPASWKIKYVNSPIDFFGVGPGYYVNLGTNVGGLEALVEQLSDMGHIKPLFEYHGSKQDYLDVVVDLEDRPVIFGTPDNIRGWIRSVKNYKDSATEMFNVWVISSEIKISLDEYLEMEANDRAHAASEESRLGTPERKYSEGWNWVRQVGYGSGVLLRHRFPGTANYHHDSKEAGQRGLAG